MPWVPDGWAGVCNRVGLVFESPVQSGLLPSRAWTETKTSLRKLKTCKRPDRTAKDRSTVVGLGLFAVTRPVLTGYG